MIKNSYRLKLPICIKLLSPSLFQKILIPDNVIVVIPYPVFVILPRLLHLSYALRRRFLALSALDCFKIAVKTVEC